MKEKGGKEKTGMCHFPFVLRRMSLRSVGRKLRMEEDLRKKTASEEQKGIGNMSSSIKISFTGDVMSYMPQNEACRKGSSYDYSPVFANAGSFFGESSFVVGNLETPVAGEDLLYSCKEYSFNTPEPFASAVRDAGFGLVSTANNHCMDREFEGLKRTLDTLDRIGLPHIGTARTPEERAEVCIREIGGMRIGFLAYTYGTNAFAHHHFLPDGHDWAVNLFQPEETLEGAVNLLVNDRKIAAQVNELYRMENPLFRTRIQPRLERLRSDAARCRAAGAEFIILLMHSGGQYNSFPDAYSRTLEKEMRNMDIDAIVGHHPHVVHPCEVLAGRPVAWSLGNFCCTPSDLRGISHFASDYSVVLHLHLQRAEDSGKVEWKKMTFSISKNVVTPGGIAVPFRVDELMSSCTDWKSRDCLAKDVEVIANVFRNRCEGVEVEAEYDF